MEISMLPIHALSMRTCATMFPPSSATAMFMGWPISLAFLSAALITRRASSNFTAVIASPLFSGSGERLLGEYSLLLSTLCEYEVLAWAFLFLTMRLARWWLGWEPKWIRTERKHEDRPER